MLYHILKQLGIPATKCKLSAFQNAEDDSNYGAWLVETSDMSYVLKKAKGREALNYKTYFSNQPSYAPILYTSIEVDGNIYLLMEYVPGHDLSKAQREDIILALDAMIAMQEQYWQCDNSIANDRYSGRANRRNYLKEPTLEQAYDTYLAAFAEMPKTLCHDDLLPFNVIISQERAVLIDWEVAGILPYPTSLARLIAHCSEEDDAFFFMKESDKAFAVDYYFNNFVAKKGITRTQFDRDLALCLLYEYCEWVYVGNKYPDADQKRPAHYLKLALQHTKSCNF